MIENIFQTRFSYTIYSQKHMMQKAMPAEILTTEEVQ